MGLEQKYCLRNFSHYERKKTNKQKSICNFCIYYTRAPEAKSISIHDIFCMFKFFLIPCWVNAGWFHRVLYIALLKKKMQIQMWLKIFESYILFCLANRVILACNLEIKPFLKATFKVVPYVWSLNIAKSHYLQHRRDNPLTSLAAMWSGTASVLVMPIFLFFLLRSTLQHLSHTTTNLNELLNLE